jgi:hypothetical protein
MRTAPPVNVSCTGGFTWRGVQSSVPAGAAAAVAAWAAGHRGWADEIAAGVALLCAAVVGAMAWWRAAPISVVLQWDGQQWTADGSTVHVHVMMGLPRWLLLRLRSRDGDGDGDGDGSLVRWLAVSASDAGPAWHGLRVALFAHQPQADAGLLADLGPHV